MFNGKLLKNKSPNINFVIIQIFMHILPVFNEYLKKCITKFTAQTTILINKLDKY